MSYQQYTYVPYTRKILLFWQFDSYAEGSTMKYSQMPIFLHVLFSVSSTAKFFSLETFVIYGMYTYVLSPECLYYARLLQ